MKVLIYNANVAPAENDDKQDWTMFSLVDGASEDFVDEANDGLIDLGDEGDLDRELVDKTDTGSLQYVSGYIALARKVSSNYHKEFESSFIFL